MKDIRSFRFKGVDKFLIQRIAKILKVFHDYNLLSFVLGLAETVV